MNINTKSKEIVMTSFQFLNPNKRLFSTVFSICLTMTSLHSAQAEDIEIYENLINTPISDIPSENDPNILFVLDTSGSMRAREAVSAESGSVRPAFDSNLPYRQPDGSESEDSNVYVYNEGLGFTGLFVTSSVNSCSAATIFFGNALNNGTDPLFANRSLLWTQESNPGDGQWRSVDTFPADSLGDIEALECEDDFGNHGINAGSAEVFPQNQEDTNTSFDPNYTSDVNDPNIVSFQSQASAGFLVPGNYHDYLQSSIEDLLVLGGANIVANNNPVNFCNEGGNNERNRDNVFVRDNAGELFQCQTRMGILKRTTAELASTLNDVNIGILRLNTTQGGTLVSAVSPIGDGTNRQDFIDRVLVLPASGFTPVTEAMFEAYSYFAGLNVQSENEQKRIAFPRDQTDDIIDPLFTIGTGSANPTLGNFVTDTDGTSVISGSQLTFISPIANQCQDNNIILFSDGQPTEDQGFRGEIISFSGENCGTGNGACLDELTGGMADPSRDVNANIPGNNSVFTYTVGFGSGVAGANGDFLRDAANAGNRPDAANDSQFFVASDSESLSAAFRSIIQSISDAESGTFAGTAVAVDTSNRLQNRDDLYFSLFEADNSPRWNGNVKGYRLTTDAEIVDSNGREAFDPDTGEFFDDAQSYWSDEIDGADIPAGGFNGELDVTVDGRERSIYASLDTDSDAITLFKADDGTAAALELAATDFVQQVDNAGISLGATDPANKLDIARWTLGIDVNDERGDGATEANFFSGDSLHSSPLVISYNDNSADDVLFAVTNQGMLHAIRAEDSEPNGGRELWSYIPDPDLFSNLGVYFNNTVGAPKTYGLDSAVTVDVERSLSNRVTSARLYFGQRRGGSKYFGVDVTNTRPNTGSGGVPGAPTTPISAGGDPIEKLWTFTDQELGQTWAAPVPAVINYCNGGTCAPRDVLVISGGYDPLYDGVVTINPLTSVGTLTDADLSDIVSGGTDVKGNAIYIVDPNDVVNGEPRILWQAGLNTEVNGNRNFSSPDMLHSFPSGATMLDSDFDGIDDLMFISDIAGQVWRFDFRGSIESITGSVAGGDLQLVYNESGISSSDNRDEVSGGVIADLSENNANRRFYNTVDVSLTIQGDEDNEEGSTAVAGFTRYNIAVGSGYRAHPLVDEGISGDGGNNGEDNFIYIIFDRNVSGPQPEVSNGEPTGDITYDYDNGNQIEGGNLRTVGAGGLDASNTGDHVNGFIVELAEGTSEKILNPSVTNSNKVLSVSYVPPVAGAELICEPDIGNSRFYETSLISGVSTSFDLPTPGINSGASVVTLRQEDANGVVTFVEIVVVGTVALETDNSSAVEGAESPGIAGGTPNGLLLDVNWWEDQGKN